MSPKLRLSKERLVELTTDELTGVAGGAPETINLGCLSLQLQSCNQTNFCTTAMSCGGGCDTFACA